MAGTYTEGISQTLSGVYTIIKAKVEQALGGNRGIVAFPITANWGPVNTLSEGQTQAAFRRLYNAESDGFSAKTVHDLAFAGKARRVMAYRVATNSAAKATATLTGAASAASITMETLYPTDRNFIAVVKDGLTKAKVIEITEGGVLLTKAEGDTVEELAEALDKSDYVRTTEVGTALPESSAGKAFSGGSNGATVTTTEFTAFLGELEAALEVGAFAFPGISDEALLTVAENFTKRVRQNGHYIKFARGGASSSDLDLTGANTKSREINHGAIINVGNGADGYTAAQLATYVAARVASVELNRTLTDEATPFSAVNYKAALTPTERIRAKEAGTLIFVHDNGKVVVDEAVSTLTKPGEDETIEMGKIRVSNALDQIARDTEAFGNEYKKTKSNTAEARETYAAAIENDYFKPLAALSVIDADYSYRPDEEYHGPDASIPAKIDEAYFVAGIKVIDSMEKVYQKIGVSF